MECELAWSGVDYIRLWLQPYEVRSLGGAEGVWVRALASAGVQEKTSRARRWRVAGLDGWLLHGVGVAENADGNVLAQVAGPGAGDFLRKMCGQGRASRIDLQVTVVPPVSRETALRAELAALQEQARNWPHRGRAPRVWYVSSESLTVYSGRRSREGIMLRVYDAEHVHGHEAGAYAGTIRYEAEASGRRAANAAEQIGADQWTEAVVRDAVLAETNRRGCLLRLAEGEPKRIPPPPRASELSVEATLRWMRKQVRSSVLRLLEAGVPRTVVEEALGLDGRAPDAGSQTSPLHA